MRRVEDNELIRFVLEGQVREVAYGIGRYLDVSIRVELETFYHAVVAVFHVWVVLIEPEHFASARDVKDTFPLVHVGIVPFLYDSFSRSMGESNRQWQVRRLPYRRHLLRRRYSATFSVSPLSVDCAAQLRLHAPFGRQAVSVLFYEADGLTERRRDGFGDAGTTKMPRRSGARLTRQTNGYR